MTSRTENKPMTTSVSPQQIMNKQYGNVINNLDRMKVLKGRPDCNSNGKNICANEAERMAETTGGTVWWYFE